jgi:hypothetical protein
VGGPDKRYRTLVHALLVLFLTVAIPPALADVYKCEGTAGVPVYQDAPCPEGRELRNFATDPAMVSILPMPVPKGSLYRESAPPPAPKPRAASAKEKPAAPGNPAERRYLAVGMQEGEVLARAGKPDMKSGGNGRKLARWTYMPAPGDPQTLTTVVLEYGKVVEVERKVVR